ncbi:MAG: flagellar basal body rod C-terminal domain-containing protein [Stutzerimonas stutzeri]
MRRAGNRYTGLRNARCARRLERWKTPTSSLTAQLVNLIVAQRNYQANAKTVETESAITQTIINLR